MIKKSMRATLYLFCLMALLTFIVGCGSSSGGDGDGNGDTKPTAEVDISALQFGESTIFSVTVKSVTGVSGATSFNLIGEETRPNTNLNEIADNFVLNKTTIPLEIYDSSGTVIASATLDAANYATPFTGTLTLSSGSQSIALASSVSSPRDISGKSGYDITGNVITSLTQIDNLDILASGIIDDLSTGTRSIQVPLTCGPTQPGNITPPAGEGFFIINDVIIEYRYGMANPVEFNNVLSVKFRESNRNFENMTLAFRLPNSSNVYRVRPEPFKLLTATEVTAILGNVNSAVSASNPWNTAIAFVDLTVTQFGSAKLVETTVTSVTGDCVIGAKSFTVQDGLEAPEPPKAIGDEVDKNTIASDLILYILGDEVQVRTQTLDTCGAFSATNSGGAAGTLDRWDISKIASAATFDFEFDAFSIPDKFKVTYNGVDVLPDTGWRGSSGSSTPDGGPVVGPGRFDEFNLFTKSTSNEFTVLVTGGVSGTAWNYRVRCNDP